MEHLRRKQRVDYRAERHANRARFAIGGMRPEGYIEVSASILRSQCALRFSQTMKPANPAIATYGTQGTERCMPRACIANIFGFCFSGTPIPNSALSCEATSMRVIGKCILPLRLSWLVTTLLAQSLAQTSASFTRESAFGSKQYRQVLANEKIILRYLNSISEKYERQYPNWIEKGHVSKSDAFVIALNPSNISFDNTDTEPPRILQAAYTVGSQFLTVDRASGKAVDTGYNYRDHIVKTPKEGAADGEAQKPPSKVTTGVFQDKQHEGLSGLLCSRVDAANRRGEIGQDFQLAPNPHANVPLPESFRLGGTYYAAEIVDSGYKVTRTASNEQAVIA
jgi:hypothetical protein